MNKETFYFGQKLKAYASLAFIYLPLILVVCYLDILFSSWALNLGNFWIIALWIYVQVLVVFFYNKCVIDIYKIFRNHKEFLLK